MERTPIILNANSGAADLADKAALIRAACQDNGRDPEVLLARNGSEVQNQVQKAREKGYRLIIVGGGDGTLNAAAQELLNSSAILGILPLGTLNHFAGDLGIPSDISKAMRLCFDGNPRKVDVGAVNDFLFLNNSSIGLYPKMVLHRETMEGGGAGPKVSLGWALAVALRRYPALSLTLHANGETLAVQTPFAFVGNNAYTLNGLAWGKRASLSEGFLTLWTIRHTGRVSLARLLLKAVFGRLENDKDFFEYRAASFRLDASKRFLQVARDGEVAAMRPPLEYKILPRALTVMTP